jgi:DNA-binding XRE family transcriptional regulator
MAEKLEISTRHLQWIESGQSAPSHSLLLDLFKVLRTESNQIFAGMV